MPLAVLDSCSATRAILHAPPADREDLLRAMLEPIAGMYRYAPGAVDLAEVHRQTSGFPLDRDGERCLTALDALEEANARIRMQHAMDHALPLLTDGDPDITVLLVLGDPADAYFMDHALGMTGFGGISGYIVITLWPFPENLDRLEATAVHELHHNIRYAPGGVVWDPTTVTVGEQVVAEGLADRFARDLYGDALGPTRIGVPHLRDDAVFAKVGSGLDVTGMANFAAWTLGDAAAEHLGATPVGLPTGAGYAAGNRLADAYLAATGRTAAQAVHDPAADVIAATREG